MGVRRSELPPLLRMEQACEVLGISRSAGYRAAAAGRIPTLRWGRRVYVPTARLLAMLGLEVESAPAGRREPRSRWEGTQA